MTTPSRPPELDGEREIDLAGWRHALARLWWLPVLGLVLGAILGVLVSLRGTTNYQASALISLGQPLSPGGSLVPSFGQNPRAISLIVASASAQAQAAAQAGLGPDALRGHVSVAQVGTATGAGAAKATPLISLTVTGGHPQSVAAAANALANTVVKRTTAAYVSTKIRTFQRTLQNVDSQITNVNRQLTQLSAAVTTAKNQKISPFEQLVVVSQADNAQARLGNLIAQQETLQQQLAFAKNVESAGVITAARAVKASAHSRGASAAVGAIIGLILGAIAAIVADGRRRRLA